MLDKIKTTGSSKADLTIDATEFYKHYWAEGSCISTGTFIRNQFILSNFFPSEIKEKRILEIGVGGEGGIILHLKNDNEVYGLDASASAKRNCKKLNLDIEIVEVDKKGISFDNEFFDIVFAFEVFEHFSNPQLVLEEVRRVLKSSGIFLASTPNPLIHHWPRIFYPNLFEEKAFREFLMVNRFRIIKQISFGNNSYSKILPNDSLRAWMWLWYCEKMENKSEIFFEYGKYFWDQKNEYGIRTKPIEAIDMFRMSYENDNSNIDARFHLTRALVYRYINGEADEFLDNLSYVFDCINNEICPDRMNAIFHFLMIYYELKLFGIDLVQKCELEKLVEFLSNSPNSDSYIEIINKFNDTIA